MAAGPPPPERRRRGGAQFIPRPDTWRSGTTPSWPVGATWTVAEIVDRVRPLSIGRPLLPAFTGARVSAVLVALADGPAGAEVLLTKRSMAMRTHRGEISFPGGRLDPGETPMQAARREAYEEVGLDPALVEFHGELEHLSTVVSRSYIVPLVASVPDAVPLLPTSPEVDTVSWVPLGELTAPGAFREEWWGTPPLERPIHFFELDGETVWGATGRMLFDLLTHAAAG